MFGNEELANRIRSSLHCHTVDEYQNLAVEHGFKVERLLEDEVSTPFDTIEMLFNHFASSCHEIDYNSFLEKLKVLAGNDKSDEIAFLIDENRKYCCKNVYRFAKLRKLLG